MDLSVSSCLGYYGLGCESLLMDHTCAYVSHCLVTGGSVVRPCLGHVGSGASLCLGQCSFVCETLPMTPWTRV